MLVAEDIEINREILNMALEETEVDLDFVCDGKAALDIFSKKPLKYDLILTDVNMPKMDGLAEARKIRALGDMGRKIPIIAMTANSSEEDIEKCLAAGMNDHIRKPLNFPELITKMQKHMNN